LIHIFCRPASTMVLDSCGDCSSDSLTTTDYLGVTSTESLPSTESSAASATDRAAEPRSALLVAPGFPSYALITLLDVGADCACGGRNRHLSEQAPITASRER
ncbi:unnamed protein product, partial [Ectocarpus sp. 13 AM-2016]